MLYSTRRAQVDAEIPDFFAVLDVDARVVVCWLNV